LKIFAVILETSKNSSKSVIYKIK